ncbi:MAG: hypothetical protein WA160_16110 [Pseudobdellovibrio sp.]
MNAFIPVSDVILSSGFSLFTKVSALMLGFVGVIFMIRIVSLQARLASVYEYGSLVKDTALYFALLSLFPYLIKLIYGISGSLAQKISFIPETAVQGKIDEFLSALFYQYQFMKIAAKIGDFLVINLAQGMYSIFTALLLSIAPIFIFMSTILGFEKGLGAYFSSIISISLWPVVWNLIGLLGKELFNSFDNSTLAVVVYWAIIHLLQFLSPLFCIFLLKSLSPSGAVTKVIGLGAKL